ncbi:MAG: hypothetical protein ACOCUR_01480 [Nanoarchaeota archaeon]
MKMKKSQSAIEFMMIIGVAFTLMIPALFIFQQFGSQANEKVVSSQIISFGREIISSIESMYYYGESSRTTIRFNFPEKITDVYINVPDEGGALYELVITADLFGGSAHYVFFTKVPVAAESSKDTGSDLTAGMDPRRNAFVSGLKVFSVESVRDEEDGLVVAVKRVVN